jgi:hypothetical protein
MNSSLVKLDEWEFSSLNNFLGGRHLTLYSNYVKSRNISYPKSLRLKVPSKHSQFLRLSIVQLYLYNLDMRHNKSKSENFLSDYVSCMCE